MTPTLLRAFLVGLLDASVLVVVTGLVLGAVYLWGGGE